MHMLKKQYRLKKRKQFSYIYRKGTTHGCKTLSVVFIASKQPTKIGFSVSKKVGNSVTRSKVTRRMREAVKIILPNLKPNINYIFVAKDGIQELKPAMIVKDMEYVLKKNGLIV